MRTPQLQSMGHFMVWVLIIVEDPTVTVKYRTKKSTVLLLEFVSECNVA